MCTEYSTLSKFPYQIGEFSRLRHTLTHMAYLYDKIQLEISLAVCLQVRGSVELKMNELHMHTVAMWFTC